MSCLMSAPTSLSTEKLHRRERSQLDADLRHLCPACLALVWTQEGGKVLVQCEVLFIVLVAED